MGILSKFFNRKAQQPKFSVGEAVIIKRDNKPAGYPVPLPGKIYSINGVDSNGERWYTVEPTVSMPQYYGPGYHPVKESDIKKWIPTFYEGDEVQGFNNPGGRGTVLEDSFLAPDDKEWVKVAWPDGTVTYERGEDVEHPDEDDHRTEGTAKPFEYYINLHGNNPQANAPSVGGSYPEWLEDKPEMQDHADPQKEQRKEQLDERLYDLYFQKDQEQYDGEMQELLSEYKELTGRDQPRFLGAQKQRFKVGDEVIDQDLRETAEVIAVGWSTIHKSSVYRIRFYSDGSEVTRLEDKLEPSGAKQQAKFSVGDKVIAHGEHGLAYGTIKKVYDFADEPDQRYLIEFDNGYKREVYEEEIRSAEEPQQTQQEQLDNRQNVDPDEQQRQHFHPSQQDLMSHIKDTGTPYFPPTPEGQKAFEQYLIKQHNDFIKQVQDDMNARAKKIGRVRADILYRNFMKRLYTEAMKRHGR